MTPADGLRVLLVGNYAPDAQVSMQRFVALLHEGLSARGIGVSTVAPSVRIAGSRAGRAGSGKWLGYADKFLMFPRQLRRAVDSRATPRLVVHICNHSNALYVPRISHLPHVVTCHDLLAVRSARGEFAENRTQWSGRLLQSAIVRGLRLARMVVCDSEASRSDLLRIVNKDPARVGMVHPGVSPAFVPSVSDAPSPRVAALLASRERYILHVGGDQWYKNRVGLVHIYAELVRRMPDTPKLVVSGKPLTADVRAILCRHNISSRVIELSSVTDRDLAALYSSAVLLLFPSWAEGFGWPVLEAMACGCRVVAANRAPLTEVGCDAITYLDPATPVQAAAIVAEVPGEPSEQRRAHVEAGRVRATQFGCDQMIDGYLGVYEELLRDASKFKCAPPNGSPTS